MKGAQSKLQATCRTAIVNDFDPARVAMSMIAPQDRTAPKPLDDSGLAGELFTAGLGALLETARSGGPQRFGAAVAARVCNSARAEAISTT